MFNHFNNVSLCKCTTCGRTFNEEAYSKHIVKCGGGSQVTASPSGPAAKPLGYVCYICGQQYGSRSLRIHVTNCQEKWEQRESVKLPRERRPVPAPPAGFDSEAPLPTTASAIEEFNVRSASLHSPVNHRFPPYPSTALLHNIVLVPRQSLLNSFAETHV